MTKVLPLAVLAALTLASCGGSGGGDDTGGAQKTLDAAANALANAKSVHIEGTQTDKDGRASIVGDLNANGNVQVASRKADGQSLTLLSVDHQTYIKANGAYWTANASARIAKALAERWVKTPAGDAAGIQKIADDYAPKVVARCLQKNIGTLSSLGQQTLAGKKVDVIQDAGDKPGTEPGRLYVAHSGTPLPLRTVATGPRRSGKVEDSRCADDGDTPKTAEDVTLSYDRPVTLRAPKNAIDLDALHSGVSGAGGGEAA